LPPREGKEIALKFLVDALWIYSALNIFDAFASFKSLPFLIKLNSFARLLGDEISFSD
jgi:hypothetical protein